MKPQAQAYLTDQYRQIHSTRVYGASSAKKAPYILPYVRMLDARSAIDYGCGQSALADIIAERCGARVARYDPAIPAYDRLPSGRFDVLINVDVLEHLPEEEIDDTLAAMSSLSDNAVIVIDTRLASTTLPDGRNAHLTLRPPEWWRRRLQRHYAEVRHIWVKRRPASFVTWRIGPSRLVTASALAGAYKLKGFAASLASDRLRRVIARI
ncbi:MAG TPA: methyltransferase domain-containing protein [Hyphomicrobiaceae bacterium]|jgi:hypothetical protein|nr:methyltransferase domain-containing protein [Hyphomicrobiaceae bacterium]